MGAEVYRVFYADDWRVSQQKAVKHVCAADDTTVWVAVDAGLTIGFIAVKIDATSSMGEIYMIAVDPDYQRRGLGIALMQVALDWMKTAGVSMAMVETGGDPDHAPARAAYGKLGFGLLPIARYFKKL